MLKYCIKTTEGLKNLRSDVRGVVSFEYVIVAAAIIVVIGAAFGLSDPTTSPIYTALSNAFTAISTKLTTAIGS